MKCARTACFNEERGAVHRDTGLRYCLSCMRKINDACGEYVVRAGGDPPAPTWQRTPS